MLHLITHVVRYIIYPEVIGRAYVDECPDMFHSAAPFRIADTV